jgi:hypothetical protein
MLHPVIMEHAERQPRVRVYLLRVVMEVCLLLHPLKLPEQRHSGILDWVLFAYFISSGCLFLNDMCVDSVVDGEPLNVVQLFNQFKTHGTPHSPIPLCYQWYM